MGRRPPPRLGKAAQGLERAGADCVLICTNTMHLVADETAAAVKIPLLNIIDETAKVLERPPAFVGRCCSPPATPWNRASMPAVWPPTDLP